MVEDDGEAKAEGGLASSAEWSDRWTSGGRRRVGLWGCG